MSAQRKRSSVNDQIKQRGERKLLIEENKRLERILNAPMQKRRRTTAHVKFYEGE